MIFLRLDIFHDAAQDAQDKRKNDSANASTSSSVSSNNFVVRLSMGMTNGHKAQHISNFHFFLPLQVNRTDITVITRIWKNNAPGFFRLLGFVIFYPSCHSSYLSYGYVSF